MFSFLKKKNRDNTNNNSALPFNLDMHSHILPGIDDGAPNVETSIDLIKGLMQLGITHSIATPHIIGDMFRNNPQTISQALQVLNNELNAQQINFKVKAAAEYMLDDYFEELLQQNTALLTLHNKTILTEFGFMQLPSNYKEIVFNIITSGYQPILAHPERYNYCHNDFKLYHKFIDLGFELQLNALSLHGYYGRPAQKAANYLVKNNLIQYVSTDLHHYRHLQFLQQAVSDNTFQSISSSSLANNKFSW
jgi:protein-tyrosine phosphatase